MSPTLTIVRNEVRCASRAKLVHAMLFVFLGMVGISSFIGWSTHKTVTSVYNQAKSQGATKVANPFSSISNLYYARNTVIYIVLIGALLAIILGVQSCLRDRKARTLDLILSRSSSARTYLLAKFGGICVWLMSVLAIAFAVNWISISYILSKVLSLSDSISLISFYLVAFIFLLPFVILGMISGLVIKNETSALLFPIVSWSIITLVIPQIGTADHPTALLNPVPAQQTPHQLFSGINQTIFSNLSISENFKHLSGRILHDSEVSGPITGNFIVLGIFILLSGSLLFSIKSKNMKRALHE